MKSITTYIILIVSCLMLTCSCRDIAPDDRFVYVSPGQVQRSILLEDFTAQRCVYCPGANAEIHQLQEMYGEDNVVAVSIHGTSLAIPETNSSVVGLKNEEGETMLRMRNERMALPAVYVNRKLKAPSNAALGGLVKEALAVKSNISIQTEAFADTIANEIHIDTYAWGTEYAESHLHVWIVEDSIQSIQMFPKGKVEDKYLHRHVFRKAVTDLQGEKVVLKVGSKAMATYNIIAQPHWNKKHLKVVTFVEVNGEVLQVVCTKMKVGIKRK